MLHKTQKEIPVFDPRLVSEELTDTAKEIMKKLDEKIFIIEKYDTIESYDDAIETLTVSMCHGFEHKEFRDHVVQYKFKDVPTEDVKWMTFRDFIISFIMWRPMICLDPDNLDESFIIEHERLKKLGRNSIKEYFDEKYVANYSRRSPRYPNLSPTEYKYLLSEVLGETTFLIAKTAGTFSQFFGISSSIEIFMDLGKRMPEIAEMMHYKIDESLQPSEIEANMNNVMNDFISSVINDERFNVLKPLIMQKDTGLNIKQLRDLCINIGLKPDEMGRTIAKPVNTNYLNGLQSLSDYYIDAISGRKAAIINYEFMGKTGHLLILTAIVASAAKLSTTVMDCGSTNNIPIMIASEKHLERMDGRRYRFRGDDEYHILNSRKDKHLIGEVLYFRSPITCCARNNGVCRECYGELYYTNIDNYATGIFSATYIMNPVMQGLLSVKHHQITNTLTIAFKPEFDNFFEIMATDIVIKQSGVDEVSDYSLILRREDIKTTGDDDDIEIDYSGADKKRRRRRKKKTVEHSEESGNGDNGDDDFSLALSYYVTRFEVAKNLHTKDVETEYIEFEDVDSKSLFLHTNFISRMFPGKDERGDYLYIDLEDINPDEFIFVVDVYNNEVTKPMKQIEHLLNTKSHEDCDTIEDMVNKMIQLLIDAGIDAMSVHGEMIIRELIRSSTNILKRPNFNRVIMRQDYQILTINMALKQSPAINTGLSTQYLKAQLVSMNTTFMKNAESIFDPYFNPLPDYDNTI